jgi:uncharacterized membrane protein YbhN (UPF0104 family)
VIVSEQRRQVGIAAAPPPVSRTARRSRVLRASALTAGLLGAAWLLAPQLRVLPASVAALTTADAGWLAAGLACTLAAHAAAALALQSTTAIHLPLLHNLQVQVASTVASTMTPAGAGALAVHTRFLEVHGVPRPEALAAVGMGRAAAVTMHIATLLVLAPALARRTGALDLADASPLLLLAAAVLALLVLRRSSARVRSCSDRLVQPLTRAVRTITSSPLRVAGLLGGSFLVSAFRALTFAAALRAIGVALPLVAVVALFLAAEALGALGSTPSGLGLLDGALVAGIVALGEGAAAGLAAVLLYRLLTLGGPMLPGLLTLRALRRARVL